MQQSTTSSSALTEESLLQILTEARAAAEAGRIEQATALLDEEVIAGAEKVTDADPSRTDLMFLMANIFHAMRELDKAEHYYRKALDHEPDPLACINMGHICHFSGRLSQAIQYRKQAVDLCPEEPSVYHDLGCSLIFTGQKEEGIETLRKAVEMAPTDSDIHSTYLFRLHHLTDLDLKELYEEHRRWAQIHAPVRLAKTSHANIPQPDRKIRVGYISGDFRTHPVAHFFEPLLDEHDRTCVEVYGYSNTPRPDHVTERLEHKFDRYRNIRSLRDTDVVNLIEHDKIDILVDLAGHTSGNSLTTLAHKPAPIAVTYL
jgi:predicted O-linked N-acetylglucosamine transferase (SPINDLY family)